MGGMDALAVSVRAPIFTEEGKAPNFEVKTDKSKMTGLKYIQSQYRSGAVSGNEKTRREQEKDNQIWLGFEVQHIQFRKRHGP